MCGIAAILWAEAEDPADAKAAVLALAGRCGIARRGPDSLDACVPAPRVALCASVLTMRSSGDARQPATDERGAGGGAQQRARAPGRGRADAGDRRGGHEGAPADGHQANHGGPLGRWAAG